MHKNIPVLAIADRDYRPIRIIKEESKDDKTLIDKKKPKILYLPVHEWENYLLMEAGLIAELINSFPNKGVGNKPCKKNDKKVDKAFIEETLKRYYKSVITKEFGECLKFNLSDIYKIKHPDKIKIPDRISDDFEDKRYGDIRSWFCRSAGGLGESAGVELLHNPSDLFDAIMKDEDFRWNDLLEEKDLFETAPRIFRGKEAFATLYSKLCEEFGVQHISDEKFKDAMLTKMIDDKYNSSVFFQDLEKLLLPIFKRCKEPVSS